MDVSIFAPEKCSDPFIVTLTPNIKNISVAAIVPDFIGEGGGRKRPTATVTVVDNLGNPVGSATVTGEFTGNASDPEASGVTNSSGNAVVSSENTKKGRLDFTFCATDVTHASLNYAPGDNVVTCATY